MRSLILSFLQKTYNTQQKSFAINYRPYEYGSLVEVLPIERAIEKIEKDICEMQEFLKAFNIENADERGIESTFKIWKKHLVIYKNNQ